MPETTTTLFDHIDHAAPPTAAPAVPNEPRQPSVMRQVALVMAASGALLWGVWATHTILTLRDNAPHLVKVELADLVREYVQREARSGEQAEELTARTANFLKALNSAVSAHARKGDIVLLGNAVVDGDVPDITATVRTEVYAHQPRAAEPAPAPAGMKSDDGKTEVSEVGHGQGL